MLDSRLWFEREHSTIRLLDGYFLLVGLDHFTPNAKLCSIRWEHS